MSAETFGDLSIRRISRLVRAAALPLILIVFLCPNLYLRAQSDLGSLTGNVTDSSGSAVANVSIEIRNVETGATRTSVSGAVGGYTFPSLTPGRYEVKFTSPGFRVVDSFVTITLAGAATFDAKLPVGDNSQQVNVQGGGDTQLQTDSHEVGTVVDEKLLTELPSNGRNILNLAVLGPGAQEGSDYNPSQFQGSGSFFATLSSSVQIGGAQNINTTFLQDGVVNLNLMTQAANIVSSVEAAQEVTTLLSGSPAKYDRPYIVNVITRGGSNHIHGVLYDFLQNEDINARNYFATTRPPIRYNLFGANLGGPILHNKLFAFLDYSGLRNNNPSVATGNVPTVAERACVGNPSAFCDFTGSSFTLYDPATYSAATGATQTFASEYGVNGIPGNRINPFAKLWLNLYPLPNVPTESNGTNYVTNVANQTLFDEFLGRVDYTISPSQQIFGTVAKIDGSQTFGSIVPGLFGGQYPNHSINGSLEYTNVLSPQRVNVARLGFNRNNYFVSQEGVASKNFAAFYGLQNLNAQPIEYAPPTIGINGISSFGTPYTPQGDIENRFEYADELDYSVGKHAIAFGAQVIRTQFQGTWSVNDNGNFNYNGQFTAQYVNGKQSTTNQGSPLGDFLLGFPDIAQGSIGNGLANFRELSVAGYVQDDWKVTPQLVLNLGLRYSFDNPPLALQGHSQLVNLNTGTATPGTWRTNYNDWSPRVGFAWSPVKGTSVIGGYGVYYTSFPYNDLQFLVLVPPNHVFQQQNYTITNPTPIETSLLPASQVPLNATSSDSFNPNAKDASTQEFNLGIEKSVTNNVVATVSYAGSLSRHIGTWSYPNQPIAPAPGSTSGAFTVTPYPNIGTVNQWNQEANANYNALLVKVSGSIHNFHGIASYTYSKALDLIDGDGNVYEVYDHPEYNYSVAGWDRPHQFTLSGVYALPIGPGGLLFNQDNAFTREAVGGWQLGSVYRLATGEPVSIGANNLTDIPNGYPMYANKVCDARTGFSQSKAEWFNISCFTQPAIGTYGRGGRNSVRSPRENQLDLSLDKSFRIREGQQLQFRGEAFNSLNHTQFLVSSQSITQQGFGAVTNAISPRVLQVGLRYSF